MSSDDLCKPNGFVTSNSSKSSASLIKSEDELRKEIALLQLARSAFALPGAFPRSEVKFLVDPWLASLLPDHSKEVGIPMCSNASSISNGSISGERGGNAGSRSIGDGSSSGSSNGGSIVSSSSSSSSLGGTDLLHTRFESWSSVVRDHTIWQVLVHPDALSHFANHVLIEHLSSLTDLTARMSCLCSTLSLVLQPAAYQPDQPWLDSMEELMLPPSHTVPQAELSVPASRGNSPWHAIASPAGTLAAYLTSSQLHQLVCFLQDSTTVRPSSKLMNMLTAGIASVAPSMELEQLVDCAYIIAHWEVDEPASFQQHLLLLLAQGSSSSYPVGQSSHAVGGDIKVGAARGDEAVASARPVHKLQPLQLLRVMWLQSRTLGLREWFALLLSDAGAWADMCSKTLAFLPRLPAEELLDMGPLLLSDGGQSVGAIGAKDSESVRLWMSAYSNAVAPVNVAWLLEGTNATTAAAAVVRLHGLGKVSVTISGNRAHLSSKSEG